MNDGAAHGGDLPGDLTGNLRQMIAVLERERQALAGLDPAALIGSAQDKERLCLAIEPAAAGALDDETLALARTAQHLNDVNRRVRNLLAANVAARLEALSGARATYSTDQSARA